MYGLIRELFENYFGTPAYNICILGPEKVGKTVTLQIVRSSSTP